jgi:hypothetical protein
MCGKQMTMHNIDSKHARVQKSEKVATARARAEASAAKAHRATKKK